MLDDGTELPTLRHAISALQAPWVHLCTDTSDDRRYILNHHRTVPVVFIGDENARMRSRLPLMKGTAHVKASPFQTD